MFRFFYNKSDKLNDTLAQIDKERIFFLTTPLSFKREIRLRWDRKGSKIFEIIQSENKETVKKSAIEALKNHTVSDKSFREIHFLKNALDYTFVTWSGEKRNLKTSDLLDIYKILKSGGKLNVLEELIDRFLEYIQVKNEHPVIQAAITYAYFITLIPFSKSNNIMAFLISNVFLIKSAYDLKRMSCFEEMINKNEKESIQYLNEGKSNGNMSSFIEFFAGCVLSDFLKLTGKTTEEYYSPENQASFYELNERQKNILNMLDNPDKVITNREIQKTFGISQITASRDLSKLSSLQLIFPHGKGRSVTYTKAF